jgi:hypothetical protein
MKVGDLVKVPHVADNLSKSNNRKGSVGFIVKIDRSPISHKIRYWVKLFGGWNLGPVPFMGRQLKVISKSS